MEVLLAEPIPSNDDKRWATVDARMRQLGYAPDALIEVLHSVQETFGYLDPEALAAVGAALGVPLSRVYGVATFYSFFTLAPHGRHTCVVCTGTACHIYGASAILAAVEAETGLAPGETAADGSLSLLTSRCPGTCSLAPVVILDGEVQGNLTPVAVRERLRAR
jgi:bidirectional [NiFe] hydrogenase diaphorase subunit